MKTTIATSCLLTALCSAAFGTMIYDIDYEPPAYTNGQHVGGGTSGETISDSINGFSSQGLLIHDGGAMNYLTPGGPSDPFTSGIHLVSWDFAVPTQQSASLILNGQLNSLSSGVLFDATLATGPTGNEIQYGDGFPVRPSVPFVVGQAYSFEVLMNLDDDYYSFWLDGDLLEDTVAIPSGADLYAVDFAQNQTLGLQAGIDNFRWEIIPEPSSTLLLLCGGILLMTWRRGNQRA